MRMDLPYELVDARSIPNQDKTEPVGILEVLPNELRIRMISGRLLDFSLDGDDFEIENDGELVTLHTDQGPIYLVAIRADHPIFKEWLAEEDEDIGPSGLYGVCAQAMR